jgi:hypothetical protein
MKDRKFRGKNRWDKFEEFRRKLPKGSQICSYCCWTTKKGRRVLYIEYDVP